VLAAWQARGQLASFRWSRQPTRYIRQGDHHATELILNLPKQRLPVALIPFNQRMANHEIVEVCEKEGIFRQFHVLKTGNSFIKVVR